MDFTVRNACLSCLDEAKNSPLGKHAFEPMNKLATINRNVKSIDVITEQLSKSKYKNVIDFYQDMRKITSESIKYYGKNTKIGLTISTVFQIFEEAAEKRNLFNIPRKSDSSFDFNALYKHIQESIVNSPDSKKQFIVMNSIDSFAVRAKPCEVEDEPYFDDEIISDFYKYLMHCTSDKAVQKYATLIKDIDDDIQKGNNSITIDLGLTSAYALNILRHQIEIDETKTVE